MRTTSVIAAVGFALLAASPATFAESPLEPLPPTFAQAQLQAGEPSQSERAIRRAAQPIPAAELPVAQADQARQIADEFDKLSSEEIKNLPKAEQIKHLKKIQHNITQLKAEMAARTAQPAAAAEIAGGTLLAPAETDSNKIQTADPTIDPLLAQLQAELEFREQVIAQLLAQLGEQPAQPEPATESALAASLLAIQQAPYAAGGAAAFIILMLFLSRGWIAELSAGKFKITFAKQVKSQDDKSEK